MKPARHVGAWCLLWVGLGCNEVIDFGVHCEPPNPVLTIEVVGPDPTTYTGICASRDAFTDLVATLHIEGQPDTNLEVDPATLEISGVTTTYTGTPQRSALVTYSLSETSHRFVGFHVAVVDLTDPRCDAQVTVDLGQDGIPWFEPATIDAAASAGAGGGGAGLVDPGLDDAVTWARAQLTAAHSLDSDGDDCPNLHEACRGTLFSSSLLEACP